jgi:protein required for attachment to host cells
MNNLSNFLLPNEPTCVVACSSARARFWRSTSRFGKWKSLADMQDESATYPEAEFTSDKPGRAFDIVGKGRHAMSPPESAQDHQTLVFARQVAEYLNHAIAESSVNKLVIFAAPKFLGYLRSELSDTALESIALAESKNVSDLDEQEIRSYLE